MPPFCSFCELEHGIVIALCRCLITFIFYEVCFWTAIQIPIQRRGRIIHVHAFFCFKCDNAYRLAVIICATMFNAVKLVHSRLHVSPAQDLFRLFPLFFHVAIVLLFFNGERKAQRKNQMGVFALFQP